MAGITLKNVSKRWGSFVGVNDFSLEIADKEFLVLLGPVSYTHLTLPTIPLV